MTSDYGLAVFYTNVNVAREMWNVHGDYKNPSQTFSPFSVTDLIKPAGQVYCCKMVDMQFPPVTVITKNVHYCL